MSSSSISKSAVDDKLPTKHILKPSGKKMKIGQNSSKFFYYNRISLLKTLVKRARQSLPFVDYFNLLL